MNFVIGRFISNITCKRAGVITQFLRHQLLSQTRQISHNEELLKVTDPKLTPAQITSILRMREQTHEIRDPKYGSYVVECNQLPSNHPIEDRKVEASLLHSSGLLFGVFDGHSGCACAQAISERLFDYVAVTIMPVDKMEEVAAQAKKTGQVKLCNKFPHHFDYVNIDMAPVYQTNLLKFLEEYHATSWDDFTIEDSLEMAFVRLDEDLSTEAHHAGARIAGALAEEALETVLSGSCACVAYINGDNIFVANVGDSKAVLGQQAKDGSWHPRPLTNDHVAGNDSEYSRLINSHPFDESRTVIKSDRLLGALAPLRAFGDVRFKWQRNDLQSFDHYVRVNHGARNSIILPNYRTPPYLTALPEITHHIVSPKDKFLVLATDGLWELLTEEEVVALVGEHLCGRHAQLDFVLPHDLSISLSEINDVLLRRKSARESLDIDQNAATHLIRTALGRTEKGDVESGQISAMLSLPQQVSRQFRDDISVTVIHLDSSIVT